jgi:hypothetical protein
MQAYIEEILRGEVPAAIIGLHVHVVEGWYRLRDR